MLLGYFGAFGVLFVVGLLKVVEYLFAICIPLDLFEVQVLTFFKKGFFYYFSNSFYYTLLVFFMIFILRNTPASRGNLACVKAALRDVGATE